MVGWDRKDQYQKNWLWTGKGKNIKKLIFSARNAKSYRCTWKTKTKKHCNEPINWPVRTAHAAMQHHNAAIHIIHRDSSATLDQHPSHLRCGVKVASFSVKQSADTTKGWVSRVQRPTRHNIDHFRGGQTRPKTHQSRSTRPPRRAMSAFTRFVNSDAVSFACATQHNRYCF